MKLPRPTLKANVEFGEGSLHIPDGWYEVDSLTRADLLQDWLYCLTREYDKTMLEWQLDRKASAAAKRSTNKSAP